MVSFKKLFIYSFLAVLGFHCCVQTFSNYRQQGLFFVAMQGFLIAVASLVSKHKRGLVAPQHVETSQTRDQTHVPCIGRWILNHWSTREALWSSFLGLIVYLEFCHVERMR